MGQSQRISRGEGKQALARGANVVRGFSLVHDPEGSHYKGMSLKGCTTRGPARYEAGGKCLKLMD